MNKKKQENTALIFAKVLEQNKPTLEEKQEFLKTAKELLQIIDKELKKRKIGACCLLGGSFAKGTYAKTNFDCDIFVRFKKEYAKFEISKILEKALDAISSIKFKKIHGSRDYFECNYKNMHFEIVPVLEVKNIKDIKNVTDASLFHVKWFLEKVGDNQQIIDNIILTKLFLKAANIYGAESFIRGFSGHVVDIMIIYYGSFLNLLKAASKWKEKEIIDINKVYKNPLQELNKAKTESPLIVIDPIQKDRNAAAGLSYESFLKLKSLARQFLKKPDISYFVKKKFSLEELKKQLSAYNSFLYKVTPLKGSKDIVGTKMLKVFEKIIKQLEINGFFPVIKGWYWNEVVGKEADAYFWFAFKEKKFSDKIERKGPPLSKKKNVELFKRKHKITFIKNNRIFSITRRKYSTPDLLIKAIQHEKFFMGIKDMQKVELS